MGATSSSARRLAACACDEGTASAEDTSAVEPEYRRSRSRSPIRGMRSSGSSTSHTDPIGAGRNHGVSFTTRDFINMGKDQLRTFAALANRELQRRELQRKLC